MAWRFNSRDLFKSESQHDLPVEVGSPACTSDLTVHAPIAGPSGSTLANLSRRNARAKVRCDQQQRIKAREQCQGS